MGQGREPVLTGGCQCGAVRYALHAMPDGPHLCHCRMCQKAFGSYFAPLAGISLADIEWTRGVPSTFSSSPIVERGFCASCGTPLSYRNVTTDRIAIALGSLDRPNAVPPTNQCGTESVVSFFKTLPSLPGGRTEEGVPADQRDVFNSRSDQCRNLQHPDHDTAEWPAHR